MLEETLTWSYLLFWENPEVGREEQHLGQDKGALPSPKVFNGIRNKRHINDTSNDTGKKVCFESQKGEMGN